MGAWNPVAVWRRTIEQLIAGDFDRLAVTKDCEVREPGMETHYGWDEEHQEFARAYGAAFSNFEITFESTVIQGSRCAFQVRYEMDHTGPMKWVDRTLPATGRRISVRVGYFITFDNEGEGALICKIHQYYDPDELIQQMEAA